MSSSQGFAQCCRKMPRGITTTVRYFGRTIDLRLRHTGFQIWWFLVPVVLIVISAFRFRIPRDGKACCGGT